MMVRSMNDSGEPRIAIISNRYLDEDQRGSEEFLKNLLSMLSEKHEVDLLTSDIVNLEPLTSPLAKRGKRKSIRIDEHSKVLCFRSHQLISSSAYILHHFLSTVHKQRGTFFGNLVDSLQFAAWGPYTPGIYKFILKKRYNAILGSTFPSTPAYIAFKAALKTNTPFIYSPYLHYRLESITNNNLLSLMLQKSKAVVAMTNQEKKELIKLGAKEESTFVIPSYFDYTKIWNLDIDKETAKKSLGLEDKFIILTNPHPLKGGIHTLEAAARLSETQDNIAVVSIGNTKREFLIRSAQIQSRYRNLKILNMGWVDTKLKWVINYASDIFCMPSVSDAFGLSYLNAWAVKVPVIAASDTSAEDVVSDTIDGFLVKYGSVESIYNSIKSLYENSSMRSSMGFKGFQKVTSRYSYEAVKSQYMRLLDYVLDQ